MFNKVILEYDECSICHKMSNPQQFPYNDKSRAAINPQVAHAPVEIVHAIHAVDGCMDCKEREQEHMALILQRVGSGRKPLFWDDQKGAFSNVW